LIQKNNPIIFTENGIYTLPLKYYKACCQTQ
jgi:hypothetical protein